MAQRHPQSFDAMRQDAIRRSREMHRRAQPPAPPPEPPPKPPEDCPPPRPPGDSIPGLHLKLPEEWAGILTNWDGEKLALAGLLYLLWKEGADPALLLALAYILL